MTLWGLQMGFLNSLIYFPLVYLVTWWYSLYINPRFFYLPSVYDSWLVPCHSLNVTHYKKPVWIHRLKHIWWVSVYCNYYPHWSSHWFLCHFYVNSVWLFTTVENLLCMYYTYYLPPFFWLQYIYIVRVHGHMCIYYTIFFNIFIYFMFILSFNLHLVLFLQLNIYVWKHRIPYKGHFCTTGR